MNPVFTIIHAIKYLTENTPPAFRDKGRQDAMHLLSNIYQAFESEHRKERPDCAPAWLKTYKENQRKSATTYRNLGTK